MRATEYAQRNSSRSCTESNPFFYELPLRTPQLFLCVVGMGVWQSTRLAFEEPKMAEDIRTVDSELELELALFHSNLVFPLFLVGSESHSYSVLS